MSKEKLLDGELIEGVSSYTAHADELAAIGPKESGLLTDEPVKASSEIFKVIVIDYCATGEGRHVFIKTGTEKSVKKSVGDWFFQGADVYTVKQWLELGKNPYSRKYQTSNIETLKRFAPVLWDAMNEGVTMRVDIEYHWNQS